MLSEEVSFSDAWMLMCVTIIVSESTGSLKCRIRAPESKSKSKLVRTGPLTSSTKSPTMNPGKPS